MAGKIQRYADFWPYYLKEHAKPTTRAFHFFGTIAGIVVLVVAIVTQTWWLIPVALVCGYFFAWLSHFFVEKNRPATFTYPLWSFISDFRMLGFWLSGRLGTELAKYQIR